MWNKIYEYGKQLVSVVQKQQKHEEDIKELRQDVNRLREEFHDLAHVVERLAYELRHDRESANMERLVLLLEI